jgi:hypothetical protein
MKKYQLHLIFSIIIFFANSAFAGKWKVLEGKYATIEYTNPYKSVADSLYYFAEKNIPQLVKMAGVSLDSYKSHKVRIILSDAPDISNGYAVGDAIVIYAISSMYVPYWSGSAKWYEMVLSHELVHHIVHRASMRKLKFLGHITGMSIPRWFHEGIAQYFAEKWNVFRGDIQLKNAVLSGELTYEHMNRMDGSGLAYPAGHAFLKFMASEYGDSSIVQLLNDQKEAFLYDFDEAFQKVYQKSPLELFKDFIRRMVLFYGPKTASYPEYTSFESIFKESSRISQIIPLDVSDSSYVIVQKLSSNHLYHSALKVQYKNGSLQTIREITNHISGELIINNNKDRIAYCRPYFFTQNNQTSMKFLWFIENLNSGKMIDVIGPVRARYGGFDQQDKLILVEQHGVDYQLVGYEPNKASELLWKTTMPIGKILLHNNEIIMEVQRGNGWRDFVILKNGVLQNLTNDRTDDRNAVLIDENTLLFNRIKNDNFTIASLNLKNGNIECRMSGQRDRLLSSYHPVDSLLLTFSLDGKRRKKFAFLHLDSLFAVNQELITDFPQLRYGKWKDKLPEPYHLFNAPDTTINIPNEKPLSLPQFNMMNMFSIALPIYDKKLGAGIYGTTVWIEALQRQALQATMILFPENIDESAYLLGHQLSILNHTMYNAYFHGPAFFSFDNGEYLKAVQDFAMTGFGKTYFINGNRRFSLGMSLSWLYHRHKILDDRQDYPNQYDYTGPDVNVTFNHSLPTVYAPFIAKQMLYLNLRYFKSVKAPYAFSIFQTNAVAGHHLLKEALGFKTHFNYTKAEGNQGPLNHVGIDRLYEIDIPRDLTFTKTIRGLRNDIYGDELIWSSSSISYLAAQHTGMKILFLPLENLTLNAFYDYAQIKSINSDNVSSFGGELSFLITGFETSVGYAFSKDQTNRKDQLFYWRISIPGVGY